MFQRVTPYLFYYFARFSAIPFSRYRIIQGMHFNSPSLHHPPSLRLWAEHCDESW